MNVNTAIILFPLLPFTGIAVSLFFKYLFEKDVSGQVIFINCLLQLLTGAYLIVYFRNYEGLHSVILSEWKHSIELSFDSFRIYFMAAFMMPLLMTLYHHRKLQDYNIRILFLFYLGGCSGLLTAGDIFNFYIFYEVMIMAAYILIAVNRKYYASIKYMIFGAASSAVFLAGIIMLYASGSYFSYSFIEQLGSYNPNNVRFILLFFSIAFFIKAAFFPVSGWVATCHSATNTLISSFLSSFTIFSGIMGLFYFVIRPAFLLGEEAILTFIGIMSLLTIMIPSVILFFEPDFKRCIAGSTIYTIGFIGLFLAGGAFTVGLTYLALHAVYKSYMFLSYDDLVVDKMNIYANKRSLLLLGVAIVFTVGFFPALPHFFKAGLFGTYPLLKIPVYLSMFLVLGSFLKFSFIEKRISVNQRYYLLFPILLTAYYLYRQQLSFAFKPVLLIDVMIPPLSFFGGRYLYRKTAFLHCLDTKFIYININYELLYIIVLFIVQIMVLRIIPIGF